MIISDIVFRKSVYKTEDNNIVAIREDNASMTIISLKSSPEYINRLIKTDWKLLAKFETTYGDLQWNIKKVTDNFAFGPLRFSENNNKLRMETVHTYVDFYISEIINMDKYIRFSPMLIWDELENNFIEEDTEITCEIYKHPHDNNGGILKIQFPEYYIIIASLIDE